MAITEEHGLLAAARAGDERAFQRLVEPYREVLEVHCYRMLGSLHDAEDRVQETLLRAWQRLDRFQERASIKTWLYRIATNACLDELDRRPRRPDLVEPFPDERISGPIADPAARYALREGMELAFLTAIQRLPGRQRAVLILRDVLGWTSPEAAELLETSVAAVNSALQRARAAVDGELPEAVDPGTDEQALLRRYVDAWERARHRRPRGAAARGCGHDDAAAARPCTARRRSGASSASGSPGCGRARHRPTAGRPS